jgi:uncharacterized protein (DUF1800 family)
MELARALTGWTVKPRFWRGEFVFDPALHDDGVKHVLGLWLEPAGQAEAEQVLERLAAHPSTARFIAAKLARRFLADDPPAEIVERAAAAFLKTGGDLTAVLRVILLDGLTGPQSAWAQPKFKRPGHFVVSALRVLNAETSGGAGLLDYLQRMGQPYFAWPTPDGFPDRSQPWQGNLLPRWQFSLALARNEVKGTQVELPAGLAPRDLLDRLSLRVLGAPLDAASSQDLIGALRTAGAHDDELPGVLAAGLLSAPAFQWR